RASMLAAIGLHAALFALLLYGLSPSLSAPRQPGYAITYADLGYAPPKGDPDGEDAPLKAQNVDDPEALEQAADVQENDLEPEVNPELPVPSDNLAPEPSDASSSGSSSLANNSDGA